MSYIVKLKEYFEKIGITQNELATTLGTSQQYISSILTGKRGIGKGLAKKMQDNYGIQPGWLLTGEGDMLKEETIKEERTRRTGKRIPFYDVEAAAGSGADIDAVHENDYKSMINIGDMLSDSEVAMSVHGNSMIPGYPPGSIVGLKRCTDSFIHPGSVYVVETDSDRYIKRLYYNGERTAFRCISDNHIKHTGGPIEGEFLYPPFEIPLKEVKRIFIVTGVIKKNTNSSILMKR